jgi:hypothetical protein
MDPKQIGFFHLTAGRVREIFEPSPKAVVKDLICAAELPPVERV